MPYVRWYSSSNKRYAFEMLLDDGPKRALTLMYLNKLHTHITCIHMYQKPSYTSHWTVSINTSHGRLRHRGGAWTLSPLYYRTGITVHTVMALAKGFLRLVYMAEAERRGAFNHSENGVDWSKASVTVNCSVSQTTSFVIMPNSKPRPIHTLSREIRETPDQSEPSYSYEDKAFIGDLGDDVEDEFHRRLSLNNHNKQREGGGGAGGIGSSSFITAGGGSIVGASGGSSFWRTDSAPLALPSRPVTLKERKSSGGLLGAAMQLHSQSSSISDDKSTAKGSSVKKAGIAPDTVGSLFRVFGTGVFLRVKSHTQTRIVLLLLAIWNIERNSQCGSKRPWKSKSGFNRKCQHYECHPRR